MAAEFVLPKASREEAIDRLACWLATCLPNKLVQVTVQQLRSTRSQRQNRYLWGVCYRELEKQTGQEAEDWHEYFLGEWSGWDRVEMFGRHKLKPRSRSSKLSVADFAEYVSFIQRRAAEYGVYIPDPDPDLAQFDEEPPFDEP
jgi:hypothetical protein